MVKNYRILAIKLMSGILLVVGVWWLVKCQCINLKALTPAALRDYIQSFGRLAALVYIIAYVLNTISVLPPIAPLSLAAGLAFGWVLGALYLMTAAMLGTSVTFMLSRYFGRSLIEKMLQGKFKNLDEKLAKKWIYDNFVFSGYPFSPL